MRETENSVRYYRLLLKIRVLWVLNYRSSYSRMEFLMILSTALLTSVRTSLKEAWTSRNNLKSRWDVGVLFII